MPASPILEKNPTFMAKKHPRDSFSPRLSLKIVTFSPSRLVSKLHSPINTNMGSCRLNTRSSRLNHGNSSLLLQEILCPSFKQAFCHSVVQWCASSLFSLCCWVHESKQLSHQLTWGRQKKWPELPKPTSSAPVSLSCLRAGLLCVVPWLLVVQVKGILSYQQLTWEVLCLLISLPMEKGLFPWRQLWFPWLKLVSGTVNEAVPTSVRQAIAWTAQKDFCKTNACIYTKSLCWSGSAIGSAFNQCVCMLTREHTLSTESHAEMYEAEHGWEVFRSA